MAIRTLGSLLILILFSNTSSSNTDVDLYDLTLEELRQIKVTTTSRTPKPFLRADGIVSVVTKDQIEILGARNLVDVINRLPATMVIADAATPADIISVRGDRPLASEHTVILINGQPFRTSGFAIDGTRQLLYAFPLSIVKKIEFVQGPGSILYGANAFTAVINIITHKERENSAFIKLSVGDFLTRKLESGLHTNQGDVSVSIIGQVTATDGWDTEFFNSANDLTNYTSRNVSHSIYADIGYKNWSLGLFNNQLKGGFYGLKSPHSTNDEFTNKSTFLNLSHEAGWSDSWTMESKLSWLNYRTSFIESTEINFDIQNRVKWGEANSILFGGNLYRLDDAKSISAKPEIQITSASLTNYHLYGQLEIALRDSYLSIGSMWLYDENSGSLFIPKLSVVHELNDNWRAKLIYSKGYRQPNALETNLNIFDGFVVGNKNLKPEEVSTSEMSLSYSGQNSYAVASVFYSRQEDLINAQFSTVPAPNFTFVNVSQRKFRGGTVEVKHSFGSFVIDAAYSWQKNERSGSKNQPERNDITQMPRHLFKLGLYYNNENYQIGLFDNYHSGYKAIKTVGESALNRRLTPTHNLSINLTWKPKIKALKNTKLSLYIHNLLNKNINVRHFIPEGNVGSYPMDTSRAAFLTIEHQFM